MQFNSFYFLLFFTAIILFYYLIPNKNYQRTFLIATSLFFVFQANYLSLLVICLIAILNYFFGIGIETKKNNFAGKFIFYLAILINISNLFFFKYYDFFLENLSGFLGLFNFKNPPQVLKLILPIGISFYTFQILGYLIDIWQENLKPEKDILVFLNYVFFFPKLLAGPIERAQNFFPQAKESKYILLSNFSAGGKLLIWGFFQKLVIADRIAIYVDSVYHNFDQHSGITLLVCSVLYVFQVYADFSGYTDIARGLAKILGYDLMINFRRPLLAFSITDFWRRWHISLSSWVNDYIYMPLSLKFRAIGKAGVFIALFVSFIIVGIWHGAKWTFVVFGVLQGIFLVVELMTLRKKKKLATKIPAWILNGAGLLMTFILITVSLIFFRSPSLKIALSVFAKININGKLFLGTASFFLYSLIGILILMMHDICLEIFKKDIFKFKSDYFILRGFPYAMLVIIILMIGVFDGGQFIYFNF